VSRRGEPHDAPESLTWRDPGAGFSPEVFERVTAWLFDLDGVLTDTASVHAAAWRETFDECLRRRSSVGHRSDSKDAAPGDASDPDPYRPFDPVADYETYVDGKPRFDGVRDFLRSRGIEVPEGTPSDRPEAGTVYGIGNRKNQLLLEMLDGQGVRVFPEAAQLARELRERGTPAAVVSASRNARAVLRAAELLDLFDAVVDGDTASEEGLAGKPAPDTFLYGAKVLGAKVSETSVVEDAPAGVAAGTAGRFGWVIGVARRATRDELLAAGADVACDDLSPVLAALVRR
jgi:beta-phosphoglucomutase family hydrolase